MSVAIDLYRGGREERTETSASTASTVQQNNVHETCRTFLVEPLDVALQATFPFAISEAPIESDTFYIHEAGQLSAIGYRDLSERTRVLLTLIDTAHDI